MLKEIKEEVLTEEERRNVIELGNVLRSVHDRLVKDGFFLPNGKTWDIFKCAKPIGESGKQSRKKIV